MDKMFIYDLSTTLNTVVISEDTIVLVSEGDSAAPPVREIVEDKPRLPVESLQFFNEEEEQCPSWVLAQMKLGLLGEYIAEAYLRDHFEDVKNVTSDSRKGYDLEALQGEVQIRVEVKTTTTSSTFHISVNELNKANEHGENYWIFFIKVSRKEKRVRGYMIPNPIPKLSIPYHQITKMMETGSVYISCNSFTIEMTPNFLMELEDEEISLTDYINTLDQHYSRA